MCRIAGIISNKLSGDELLQKTHAMCSFLAHGGPDDEGVHYIPQAGVAFGHRRLAIIDLSSKGHQPMADTAEKAWITFNGEIYNYPELRTELLGQGAVFHSDTDTEVIIQAYIKWGTDSFARLRGMFAFALYDTVRNLTYLVRDSAGIKPVYYCAEGGQLSFASEVKALKNSGLPTEIDEHWPIRFLAFGHMPEPYTFLKNVFSLPKGHFLCWDNNYGSCKIQSYALSYNNQTTITDIKQAEKNINDTLNKTIKRQLVADAEIGVFLSGGVDSSLLTLLAERYKKNLKTVSIFFDEKAYDERYYQQIILDKTGVENYAHLVKQQDFAEALPQILSDMDMPTTDGINTWYISKYAHQSGLKAVLSGLGADELFGGYPSFKRIKYLKYLKNTPRFLLKTIAGLSAGRIKRIALLTYDHPLAEYLFLRGLFVPADIASILNITEREVTNILFSAPMQMDKMEDSQKASWFETNLYMQNQLLRDTDVMSMAHALEVRVPFLDEDFQQLSSRITPAILFNTKQPKKLLIDSFNGLLPPEIWNRPKMGFTFPLQQWMARHHDIGNVNFYKGKAAQKFIKRFRNNDVHWSKAFALYQLQLQPEASVQTTSKKMLLLTLQTFSATGGIQKMTRTMAYALQQIAKKNHWRFSLLSGYDHDNDVDTHYLREANFKGFNKNRSLFVLKAVSKGLHSDIIILSHINLAPIGWFIKLIRPKSEVWIVAHGIEIWRPLTWFKKNLLSCCDKIMCVSAFTRQKTISLHGVDPAKCMVMNNALDPYIKPPLNFIKPDYLLQRYHLNSENKIIFTLTRLASTEQYKGYEQVIRVIGMLKAKLPGIRYILSGKYDTEEGERINGLIKKYAVEEQVIVTGFIKETELEDHFLLADLFVLPSKKEGFGIVFIEALACGLPVICGDGDGSIDAIRNGELGTAINVDDIDELKHAISKALDVPLTNDYRRHLQNKCLEYFNTNAYTNTLEKILC